MLRLLRFGLVWILSLAMPMQGMAATGITSCTSGHHAATTVRSTTTLEAAVTRNTHRLDPAVNTQISVDSLAGPASDAVQTQLPTPGHGCSAGADCCTGLALPNAPLAVATPETAAEVRSESRPRSTRAGEEAPERPPRAWRA